MSTIYEYYKMILGQVKCINKKVFIFFLLWIDIPTLRRGYSVIRAVLFLWTHGFGSHPLIHPDAENCHPQHEADQTSCSGFKREEAEMSKSELEDCSPSVVKLFRDSVLDGDIDSRLPQLLRSLPSLCWGQNLHEKRISILTFQVSWGEQYPRNLLTTHFSGDTRGVWPTSSGRRFSPPWPRAGWWWLTRGQISR